MILKESEIKTPKAFRNALGVSKQVIVLLKRKITYALFTILLLGGLCYVLNFVFGLFTPYNFWTARQDIKDGKIQIAEIGEMPLNFDQKQKLANSYGFDFHLFGCDVTSDIIKGTKYYNNVMIDHLESKYGVGWWTKFQAQLDSIDNQIKPLNHFETL